MATRRLQSRKAHKELLTETDMSDDDGPLSREPERQDLENDDDDDDVLIYKVITKKKEAPLKSISGPNGTSNRALNTRSAAKTGKKGNALIAGQSMLSGWLTKAKPNEGNGDLPSSNHAQKDVVVNGRTTGGHASAGRMVLDSIDVPFFPRQKRALYTDSPRSPSPAFESFAEFEVEEVEPDFQDSDSDASFAVSDDQPSERTTSSIGEMSDAEDSVHFIDSGSDIEPSPKRVKLNESSSHNAGAVKTTKKRSAYFDDDHRVKPENDSSHFIDKFKYRLGIDDSLPPMSSNAEIFQDLVNKSVELGMAKVVNHLQGHKLRIGTMCSGTESPILALNRLSEFLPDHGLKLEIDHVFSAEIVPFKQAYIENNFPGSIIFRDVVEVGNKENDVATTVYGSKATIPGDIDVLIAGSSCVDFSNLNTRKKEVDDGGESGDTFGGVRNYAEKYSPKIVILENVRGSARVWKDLTSHMTAVGYTCKHSFLDPKDYYIPQTRERGYMICISNKLGSSNLRTQATERYMNKMESFERGASSSAECFLLDHDDPRIVGARVAAAFDPVRALPDWDWVRNMVGHRNYRQSLGLGRKHYLTQWEDGGFAKGPDFYDRQWFNTQGERVYDMIDISYLRGITRGYDQSHKFRFLDVSQNPFNREEDTKAAGIVGCITPKGIHFSSTRGGAIHGIECIALQGLPIDKLTFTRETHSQLKDLAGNAMTTTVVGAVLYSALLSTYKWLPSGKESNPQSESVMRTLKDVDESQLVPLDFGTANSSYTLSKQEVLSLAMETIRMCHCEDLSTSTKVDLQKCTDCGHTSCIACGIDKKHHKYVYFNPPRQSPATFISMMRKKLPISLRLSGISIEAIEAKQDSTKPKAWRICKDAVAKAIDTELRFESIKRSSIWTVTYASDFAQLELTISSSAVEWLLFVKPDRMVPGNHPIRGLLSHPILRMKTNDANIMEGNFQIWVFQDRKIPIQITPFGPMKRSFQDVIGLSQYIDTFVHEQYRVSVENGDSKYLDIDVGGVFRKMDCQHVVPMGSLHIREESDGKPRLALFVHHDRLGAPEDDGFIFSNDLRRLNHYDHRRVVATLPPQWRPPIYKPADLVAGYTDGDMVLFGPKKPNSIEISITGHWCDVEHVSYEIESGLGCKIHVAEKSLFSEVDTNSCATSHAIIKCTAVKPQSSVSSWAKGKWITVNELNYRDFFTEFAWLMQKSGVALDYQHWTAANCHESRCMSCAPKTPSMQWTIQSEENKDGSKTKKDKQILVPVENPFEAAPFERAMRSRPEALTVQFIWEASGRLELKMGFNPQTLMHRAVAKLIGDSPPSQFSLLKTSWRLSTDSVESAMPELIDFKLRDNLKDDEAMQPPGFHKCFKLRPEQLRSLNWMLEQENSPLPFVEEEIEEVAIPQIGWRGEGRAERSVTIKGGVLADATGYGKTITSLALMSHQRTHDIKAARAQVYGRINIRATLILVPNQLPKQWFGEATKFLRHSEYKVLLLENIRDLERTTFSEFEKADVIIAPWSLFDNEEYLYLLAQLSGMVEPPMKPEARIVGAWYNAALKNLETHVELMKSDPSMLSSTIASTFEKARNDAAQVESYVPSKRITGQAYQDAKAKKAGNKNATAEKAAADKHAHYASQHKLKPRKVDTKFNLQRLQRQNAVYQEMRCPLLELFSYSRVIVDEYAYTAQEGGPINTIISNLNARARWILSATPPMETFADIKFMARALGVNLGIDDLTPGVVKTKTIEALIKGKTKAELFQSFKKPPSGAWHENRWLHAQKFLAQFVRQNQAELGTIPGSDHIMAVTLPPIERATYIEIYRLLASAGFVVRGKSKNVADQERAAREAKIFGTSKTADEVLLRAASYVDLEEGGARDDDNPEITPAMKVKNFRFESCQSVIKDIKAKLMAAEWLSRNNGDWECSHYINWKKSIRGDDISEANDDEAKQNIIEMLEYAEAHYDPKHRRDCFRTQKEINADDEEAKKEKAASKGDKEAAAILKALNKIEGLPLLQATGVTRNNQLRANLKLLCKYSSDLSDLKRSLRYSTAVVDLEISGLREAEDNADAMDVDQQLWRCNKCSASYAAPRMFLLSSCGHMFCQDCRNTMSEQCASAGCQYPFKDFQVAPATVYVADSNQDSGVLGCHGQKLIEIVQLIQRIPQDEQVLLFMQGTDLMKVVEKILDLNGITVASLSGGNSANILTEFQEGKSQQANKKGVKRKTKVLMMNIGDSSAAGANLTMANHVIFVSPYLIDAESNGTYNAAMTQAKGRARRFGQTKPVHFYQFLSLNTIDVNILQKRTGMVPTYNTPIDPEFKPYHSFQPASYTLEEGEPGSEMDKQGIFRQPDIADVYVPNVHPDDF